MYDIDDNTSLMKLQVPHGHCWLLGDNRFPGASFDSFSGMGPVPLANITGKVLLRFGPEGFNWIRHGPQFIPEAIVVEPQK